MIARLLAALACRITPMTLLRRDLARAEPPIPDDEQEPTA